MKPQDKPVWKVFEKLRKRLRAGLVFRYPDSSKHLEVVKNAVREQFPIDKKALLEEIQAESKGKPKNKLATGKKLKKLIEQHRKQREADSSLGPVLLKPKGNLGRPQTSATRFRSKAKDAKSTRRHARRPKPAKAQSSTA